MFLYEISYEQETAGMSKDLHIIIKVHLCSRPKLGIRFTCHHQLSMGSLKMVGLFILSYLHTYMFLMSAVDTRRHLLGF